MPHFYTEEDQTEQENNCAYCNEPCEGKHCSEWCEKGDIAENG